MPIPIIPFYPGGFGTGHLHTWQAVHTIDLQAFGYSSVPFERTTFSLRRCILLSLLPVCHKYTRLSLADHIYVFKTFQRLRIESLESQDLEILTCAIPECILIRVRRLIAAHNWANFDQIRCFFFDYYIFPLGKYEVMQILEKRRRTTIAPPGKYE